jgi:hypothetical protein
VTSAFLPVHWGTFNLAMHAWDQPAEALFDLGPKLGVHLVMPRLGEPVQPSEDRAVEPWWRPVDMTIPTDTGDTAKAMTLPKEMPWPID